MPIEPHPSGDVEELLDQRLRRFVLIVGNDDLLDEVGAQGLRRRTLASRP